MSPGPEAASAAARVAKGLDWVPSNGPPWLLSTNQTVRSSAIVTVLVNGPTGLPEASADGSPTTGATV